MNPSAGGPVEGIKQLGAVNRKHHHIEVVSLDSPAAPFLETFPFPVHALGPSWKKYGYSNRMVPWLRENAKDYDVMIVNGLWQYHGFAVWRALSKTQSPYVVYAHGMLDPWFKKTYPLKHLKKMLYWPWAEYRILRDAQAVLFTCEEERLLARQSFRPYRCNEVVVKYGTAGPESDPASDLDAFAIRFPELRGKRLAIFLGRLHEKKGCDLLIQAFAKVLASDPSWHLVMCGPDQVGWKTKLTDMAEHLNISDRITWPGLLSGDLKWGALRASEVFVLPSHQENFGIAVAEALACGVPVLISDKVNIWREVQNSGAGIVATDDFPGTCSLLQTWAEMPMAQRSEMRSRARDSFFQNFEIHAAAESLCQTLLNVIAGRTIHAEN